MKPRTLITPTRAPASLMGAHDPTRAPADHTRAHSAVNPHARRVRATVVDAMVSRPGDGVGRPARTFSSSREAFPRHCDYACSVEVWRRRLSVDERVALFALFCAIVFVVWG